MRVMAVDYGDTRTGIAVSDMSGTLTGQAWTITEKDAGALAQNICELARERQVETIVLGYPRNMDGSVGPRAEKSEEFARLLRENGAGDVRLWDERQTTVSAEGILRNAGKRGKKKKNVLDAVAASLILESYLASV